MERQRRFDGLASRSWAQSTVAVPWLEWQCDLRVAGLSLGSLVSWTLLACFLSGTCASRCDVGVLALLRRRLARREEINIQRPSLAPPALPSHPPHPPSILPSTYTSSPLTYTPSTRLPITTTMGLIKGGFLRLLQTALYLLCFGCAAVVLGMFYPVARRVPQHHNKEANSPQASTLTSSPYAPTVIRVSLHGKRPLRVSLVLPSSTPSLPPSSLAALAASPSSPSPPSFSTSSSSVDSSPLQF